MLVLGLQGSPRKKGNTSFLLSTFLKEAENLGAKTDVVEVSKKNILPCKGCGYCEKEGFCVIEDDDMQDDIFPLLRQADVIVAATPIFFYSATGQLKILIDRCQTLWSRKYKLNLNDPGSKTRQGFLLALGATSGKNLFEGVTLTAKYFFDAIGAGYSGSLTYRRIEGPGDLEKHPSVLKDVKEEVSRLLKPFLNRKKILFVCRENACRSRMAAAFARYLAGDEMEVVSGGSNPAGEVNPVMVEVMEEKGIDMAFRRPRPAEEAIESRRPDVIISVGCGDERPFIPGVKREDWDLPDPAGQPIDFMRNIRDEIEKKVKALISDVACGEHHEKRHG